MEVVAEAGKLPRVVALMRIFTHTAHPALIPRAVAVGGVTWGTAPRQPPAGDARSVATGGMLAPGR